MTRVSTLTLGLLALCCLTSGQTPSSKTPEVQGVIAQCPGDQGVIEQCLRSECPGFIVVERTKDYELRRYAPSKWVYVDYIESPSQGVIPGSDDWMSRSKNAFEIVSSYFKGNNSKGAWMHMTLPVVRKVAPWVDNSTSVTMQFMVPYFHQEDTPTPTNTDVHIGTMIDVNAYVRTFGGFATEAKWAEELSALKTALRDPSRYMSHSYLTAGYDPPWKETGRRNEVWLIQMPTVW